MQGLGAIKKNMAKGNNKKYAGTIFVSLPYIFFLALYFFSWPLPGPCEYPPPLFEPPLAPCESPRPAGAL